VTIIKKVFEMKELLDLLIARGSHLDKAIFKSRRPYFRDVIYLISEKNLDDEDLELIGRFEEFVKERTSTNRCFGSDPYDLDACHELVAFAVGILESAISNHLKIALYGRLNIVGYIFDRTDENLHLCNHPLSHAIDTIEKYKINLPHEMLDIWNNSTYGGASQVQVFRDHLNVVMARRR
jgi:hypothetical protein